MTTTIDAPGWTTPLPEDGWFGQQQKFPTAGQTVQWVRCPTCGAARGEYCSLGRRNKKTGELLSLEDWLESNGRHAPAPSCDFRRRDARKELKRRQKADLRRLAQVRVAVYGEEVAERMMVNEVRRAAERQAPDDGLLF